jgi:hypothetical protein
MCDPIRGMVADQIIDRNEAKQAVRAFGARTDAKPLADALVKSCRLSQSDALASAVAIQTLAKDPLAGKFIHFRPNKGVAAAADFSHEGVSIIGSADLTRTPVAGVSVNLLKSWGDLRPLLDRLKVTLDQRRKTDPQAHLTLVLNVHGNNGTGFKLVTRTDTALPAGGRKRVDDVSVASSAFIQQELAAAGLKPEDVTLVSEACNGAHSYLVGIDGLSADEQARIKRQVRHLSTEDAADWKKADARNEFQLGTIEIRDASAGRGTARNYGWVGWDKGVNATYAFLSYGAGQQTKTLKGAAAGAASPGAARMVAFSQLSSARLSEGMISNTPAERAELERQFAANGGGKPFALAATPAQRSR